MTSHRKKFLIHKTAMTVVALAVAAFATSLVSADVVVMNQPSSEDIFSSDVTTSYDGSGLTVDVSSGDVTMSHRGAGGPGPYIATEPIRIIEGSRALTTAYYNGGGGGGRPYFGGSASSIPEPSSLALLGLGAAGLLTSRKRRR